MQMNEGESKEGQYLYCIIGTDKERSLGPIGIGKRGDEVHTISHRGIACVVSRSPVVTYPISRENTISHQKVIEEVMREYTVLPVRFCTIADSDGIADPERKIKQLLEKRHGEFKDLLNRMDGKVELGVKALWNDMETIFGEILEEKGEIRRLREAIAAEPPEKTYYERIKIGEMVRSALEEKKEREGGEILRVLKKLSADLRTNKTHGDKMILNAAFLVDKANQAEFDRKMNELESRYRERMKLKYVGPIPPFNFVEIVVVWD